MSKFSKRALSVLLAAMMVVSMVGCKKNGDKDTTPTPAPTGSANPEATPGTDPGTNPGEETREIHEWDMNSKQYVYKNAVGVLAKYWNIHDYETTDDAYPVDFIVSGLYNIIFNDELHAVEGREPYAGYKIIPEMAAGDPVDVTEAVKAAHPEFNIPESATKGYAYQIDLNKNACWENGTPINADTYIYSMKQLLDPKMINYRATDYFSGALCIAGAEQYYYGGRTVKTANSTDGEALNYQLADLVKGADGIYETPDGKKAYFGLEEGYAYLGGEKLKTYYDYGYIPAEGCWDVLSAAAEDGFAPVTDETIAALESFITSDFWGNEPREFLGYYMSIATSYDAFSWDNVGCLKTGDYQITLVFGKSLAGFNLYYNLTNNWLVYEPYYEACKKEVDGAMTTDYCTSVETTMSYGPYKLVSYQADKAMRFERNEKWYGYTDNQHIYVDPEDGETYRMFQTDVIDCQVVGEAATRKMMFLKGELMGYSLQAEDFAEYRGSDYAYATPRESLFFFIFNGNKAAINEREAAADFDTTKYDLQTITLENFRRAIAVTYDKELFASTISPSRSGGYGLIGIPYIYDPDTGARYRDTDQAKKTLCDFYSVDVSKYPSLDAAVDSITGYDPVKAKELFTQTFTDALEAGYITDADGDGKSDQMIQIEYCCSEVDDFITKTLDYLNEKLADVLVGTPFEGKVVFVASVPYGTAWSSKIKAGLSDVVIGAWEGSRLDPFGLARLYTDPAYQYDAAWFDASTKNLTLTVNVAGIGNPVSKKELTTDIQKWSEALLGGTITIDGTEYCFGEGIADIETRLEILAGIEGVVLLTYDYIPMLQDGSMALLSQQVYYVVEEYNPILGRGGITYLKYNYNEDDWKAFVQANGGELNY